MANLLTLASFYRAIQDQIELDQGEVSDETLAELEGYEDSIHNKVDAIAVLIDDCLMWAERFKADAAELKMMEMKKRNQAERFRKWLQVSLDAAGMPKAGTRYPWLVKDNATPSFTWDDIGKPIPKEFQKVKPAIVELDTKKCAELWRQEVSLPPGIGIARGRHVQPAYRRPKKGVLPDGTDE